MNSLFMVDHAKCIRGHYTPIRPSTLRASETDPEWKGKGEAPVVFACNECKRVYCLRTDELEARSTPWGVGPENPGARVHVFQVPIPCDDLDCVAQLVVLAALKSDTTVEQLIEQRSTWRWAEGDLKCPWGHVLPWPQWERASL
jgi:hypothetical protein